MTLNPAKTIHDERNGPGVMHAGAAFPLSTDSRQGRGRGRMVPPPVLGRG